MNATHIAGYVGLSDTYTIWNFFIHMNESLQLLTEVEYECIKQIDMNAGGSSY